MMRTDAKSLTTGTMVEDAAALLEGQIRTVRRPPSRGAESARYPDSTRRTACIAMIGLGRWGGNLLRCFSSLPRVRLCQLCDVDPALLATRRTLHPGVATTSDVNDVFLNADVEAVVIATPAPTHYELVRRALLAGKHVFCEKPLALSVRDARELVEIAATARRSLMVGHLLEYHPAIDYLRRMIADGKIGDLYYIYSQRLNLGVVRRDENAWWSLAPHDVSVVCDLMGQAPIQVSAHGRCFLQNRIEDVVFATLQFADGRAAHIHVSWLDPHKIRKVTLVGSKRMVTVDDMEATEKIRVYDKGVYVQESVSDFAEAITLRSGDILIPKIANTEPLRIECQHFVDAVLDGTTIRSDGEDGLRVVRVLEAGQRSIECDGMPVEVI